MNGTRSPMDIEEVSRVTEKVPGHAMEPWAEEGWQSMVYTRTLAPFLTSSDLMRLSRTCKALVPLRGQVWELATWNPTIATALAQGQLPSLTHIRIDHRRLGPEGAALLLPHAEHSHPVLLVSLHLWNTGLGARGTQVLAEGLKPAQTLRHVSLGYNGMGTEGAQALAPVLGRQLLTLALPNNDINTDGLEALVSGLTARVACLQGLNLSGNSLGPEGASLLTPLLQRFAPSLALLDLSSNQLGPQGLTTLVEALSQGEVNGRVLSVLKLGNNQIQDNGAKALARALARGVCPRLAVLNLSDNQVDHAGAWAVVNALKPRKELLRQVTLQLNFVSREDLDEMQKALWAAGCNHLSLMTVKPWLSVRKPAAAPAQAQVNEPATAAGGDAGELLPLF